MTDDGGQMTDDRKQMTEVRRRKADFNEVGIRTRLRSADRRTMPRLSMRKSEALYCGFWASALNISHFRIPTSDFIEPLSSDLCPLSLIFPTSAFRLPTSLTSVFCFTLTLLGHLPIKYQINMKHKYYYLIY
jgi:hypothetical protein